MDAGYCRTCGILAVAVQDRRPSSLGHCRHDPETGQTEYHWPILIEPIRVMRRGRALVAQPARTLRIVVRGGSITAAIDGC